MAMAVAGSKRGRGTDDDDEPLARPRYWLDGHNTHESRYMRRKLEYLLRTCGSADCTCAGSSARHARVVRVDRVENDSLWMPYATRRRELRGGGGGGASGRAVAERSRPIRCELDDDEAFLFHGTTPEAADAIANEGFDPTRADEHARYGRGVYFTDEACKAQQYAGSRTLADGGVLRCVLYCRVALGRTLSFRATGAAARRGYLAGMGRPAPDDAVFRTRLAAAGRVAAARAAFDSVDVREGPGQWHRELVGSLVMRCHIRIRSLNH